MRLADASLVIAETYCPPTNEILKPTVGKTTNLAGTCCCLDKNNG
jgi:hypothetical protein